MVRRLMYKIFGNLNKSMTHPKAVFCVLIAISIFNKAVMGSIVNMDNFPQSHDYESENRYGVYHRSAEATTGCTTPSVGSQSETANTQNGTLLKNNGTESTGGSPAIVAPDNGPSIPASKLYALVQHIYAAQARVQLEVNEIKRAQAVASSAQKSLEEAANNVRVITAALQSAQQEVAAAAVRAQTAQMQLAAHDQLLFAARQKVDALSSQMVGLQAEDGVGAAKNSVNVQNLLSQLKEPLAQNQTPTPIPAIDKAFNVEEEKSGEVRIGQAKELLSNDDFYWEASF